MPHTPTPTYNALRESAGHLRSMEYCGAETAAAFAATAGEYEALRTASALYDLGWRAKLLVTGPDRVRWLNGMVTNNIKDLPLQRGLYNYVLNAQGRIQADLYAYNRGECIVLDIMVAQTPKLHEYLQKFIIMDDVEITDAGAKLTALGLRGPSSQQILRAAGIFADELEPLQIVDATCHGVGISLVRGLNPKVQSYEIWLAPANALPVWNALLMTGAAPIGAEAIELARIAAGTPLYGQDIRERDLPQETDQPHALNFRKGCYIGQEIVERIHARGAVHRRFTGFTFADAVPAPGAKVMTNAADSKEIGEITSAASLPSASGPRHVALGYIRREAGTPGASVQVDGHSATVTDLPFEIL